MHVEIQTRDRVADKAESALMTERCGQLQTLVCELLAENQTLRAENRELVAHRSDLERRAESAERGLEHATKWAGMVL